MLAKKQIIKDNKCFLPDNCITVNYIDFMYWLSKDEHFMYLKEYDLLIASDYDLEQHMSVLLFMNKKLQLDNELLKIKNDELLKELETSNQECSKLLEKIKAYEAGNSVLWGLPAYIMEEKRKGATCFEVAKHLKEKYNFSKATIAALMHPEGDISDCDGQEA